MRIDLAGGKAIELVQGNITRQDTHAVVNAANSTLLGGGGVDGAIHRAGGPAVLEECRKIRETKWKKGLPPGEAVSTTAGEMQARYVIHTVGPIWEGGDSEEPATLAACYRNSIHCAEDLKLESIAFPAISTGAFGYPLLDATDVAIGAVRKALAQTKHVKIVRFVVFDQHTFKIYSGLLETIEK